METFQAIIDRKSCRSFHEKPVTKDLVEKLIDAGRRAPSANNIQPVEYIIVTDADMREKIASITDYGGFLKNAPACIVVIAQDTKYFLEDGCAAVENILIAASDQALGACWIAGDKKDYAESVLELLLAPANYKLVALIPVGWPKTTREPREKKPLVDVLHWHKF